MYKKGEISEDQINTLIAIRNLTDEEWSQIKKDYIEGNIGKEEFEQIKQIREMPEDWTTLENGVKGLFYGIGTGAWEGVQWYLGGKLAGWTFKGSKVATSATRIGVDTVFNTMDTPYRTLLGYLTTENTLEESWADQGGWNSVLTSIGVGFIGSTGGEFFDSLGINRNIITNSQNETLKYRTYLAKKQMRKYFKKNPNLCISKKRLKEAFAKIIPCQSDEEFADVVHKLTLMTEEEIKGINAMNFSGTIILRPSNSMKTIIHEANHKLGNVHGMAGGARKVGTNTRGFNEAFTESLALKIAGIDGSGPSGYARNVTHLNRIINILENAGYTDIAAMAYYTGSSDYLANIMNQIVGDNDFYDEIVKNMDIADGWGDVRDKMAIEQANIYIEGLINLLEKRIGG